MPLEEVKEPVDAGPRPWDAPRIPMAEPTKSNKQKIDEAISQMKVRGAGHTLLLLLLFIYVLKSNYCVK